MSFRSKIFTALFKEDSDEKILAAIPNKSTLMREWWILHKDLNCFNSFPTELFSYKIYANSFLRTNCTIDLTDCDFINRFTDFTLSYAFIEENFDVFSSPETLSEDDQKIMLNYLKLAIYNKLQHLMYVINIHKLIDAVLLSIEKYGEESVYMKDNCFKSFFFSIYFVTYDFDEAVAKLPKAIELRSVYICAPYMSVAKYFIENNLIDVVDPIDSDEFSRDICYPTNISMIDFIKFSHKFDKTGSWINFAVLPNIHDIKNIIDVNVNQLCEVAVKKDILTLMLINYVLDYNKMDELSIDTILAIVRYSSEERVNFIKGEDEKYYGIYNESYEDTWISVDLNSDNEKNQYIFSYDIIKPFLNKDIDTNDKIFNFLVSIKYKRISICMEFDFPLTITTSTVLAFITTYFHIRHNTYNKKLRKSNHNSKNLEVLQYLLSNVTDFNFEKYAQMYEDYNNINDSYSGGYILDSEIIAELFIACLDVQVTYEILQLFSKCRLIIKDLERFGLEYGEQFTYCTIAYCEREYIERSIFLEKYEVDVILKVINFTECTFDRKDFADIIKSIENIPISGILVQHLINKNVIRINDKYIPQIIFKDAVSLNTKYLINAAGIKIGEYELKFNK